MGKYLMPAEWEKHEATWLAWPHFKDHWPGKFEPVPYVYAEIIRALVKSEPVYLCVNDSAQEKAAFKILKEKKVPTDLVKFFVIPNNTSWIRDYGAIVVRDQNRERVLTDWKFNAWGNQWPHELDDVVPQRIGEALNLKVVQTKLILEGGSIDVNGSGSLLTTTQCLLNPNRNGGLNKEQIEKFLAEWLGATNVLWLTEGVEGDDTSGHVDDIARFVNKNTVVCGLEKNRSDINHAALKANFELLETFKDETGKALKVVAIPMPAPVMHEGVRLPASYANFYISNKSVLVPTFNCSEDKAAIKVLEEFFPDRAVAQVDCTDLIWGLGAIHCSSQQFPAA